jgi:hypothetical protein
VSPDFYVRKRRAEVRHRLTLTITIQTNHPAVKSGQSSVYGCRFHGNIASGAQRTVYFEQVITNSALRWAD